ncbi:dehydrogenase/reductase SDR family member 11-like isoform X1 [Schistocerca serialis cubense]|uniref:dehydrogenase/reductase SDR family member 11-like isoform X1 n=1 Tax=Schistocerca serialis cubense TaxID=2023355 RepID=UPI00214E5986|nr:dehydrogenase/reductase SDR family member 11-like isoform X1 [Schistocerca serialis cubense]
MERYAGRVAMVTGASSGIGAAVARALLQRGLTVVGVDLRPDRMKEWQLNDFTGQLHPLYGDVSDEESILSVFKWITDTLGGVDILVNCAGLCRNCSLISAPTSDWKLMLDVNLLGLSICTREAVQDMFKRGVDDGFIVHICSIAGHVPIHDAEYSMYYASKVAVKTLLEGLRKDLVARKSDIRVGQICPGVVRTEIFKQLTGLPDDFWEGLFLEPEDIAEAVVFMLSQHPRVQVHDIIIRATGSDI